MKIYGQSKVKESGKMKKQAHVISHSHWDREWYLPYEKHHCLEVEFMDRLLDTMERDPDFKSFHLDGQTIMLDDYLQVRPEKKELVEKLVKGKRLYICLLYTSRCV